MKKKTKKLVLAKETVRKLGGEQLQWAVGGITPMQDPNETKESCGCTFTCYGCLPPY